MKTWEMIKELTENPSKRFTCNTATKGSYVTVENRVIVWRGQDQEGQKLGVDIADEGWKEVKKPVSFMEAVESGKKIRVNHPHLDSIDYLNIRDLLKEIISNRTIPGIGLVLLDGKFYIED